MSLFKKIALISFVLLFFNCSSDNGILTPPSDEDPINEEPTTEIYFTLKAYEYDIDTESWVIIHDANGELLDYQSYESGDNLVFEGESSNITDKISVTILGYNEDISGYLSYNHALKTTTNVDKGSIWDQNPAPPRDIPSSIGTFKLTLNNFPDVNTNWIRISNELGALGYSSTGTGSGGVWTHIYDFSLFEKNDYLISFMDTNGDFKYHFINDVQNEQNIHVDYSEFSLFDDYLNINLPSHNSFSWTLQGFEDNQDYNNGWGYMLSGFYTGNYETLKIGYLNMFSRYISSLAVQMDGYDYIYKKIGEKPEEIVVPEKPSFVLENETLNNFEFSTDVSFIGYQSLWRAEQGEPNIDYIRTSWSVVSSSDNFSIIGQLPDEILLNYPSLEIQNLEYENTNLTLNTEENIVLR